MDRAFGTLTANTANQQVVAGTDGMKIRVLAVFAMAGATATTLTFKSASGGSAVSPAFPLGANGGFVLPFFTGLGWCESAAGHGLFADVGAGSNIVYVVFYEKSP